MSEVDNTESSDTCKFPGPEELQTKPAKMGKAESLSPVKGKSEIQRWTQKCRVCLSIIFLL